MPQKSTLAKSQRDSSPERSSRSSGTALRTTQEQVDLLEKVVKRLLKEQKTECD